MICHTVKPPPDAAELPTTTTKHTIPSFGADLRSDTGRHRRWLDTAIDFNSATNSDSGDRHPATSVHAFPRPNPTSLNPISRHAALTRLRLRPRTQLLPHPPRPHPLEIVPTLATTRRRIKYRTAMQPSSSVSLAAPSSLFKLTQTHAFLFRPEQEMQIEHLPLPDH